MYIKHRTRCLEYNQCLKDITFTYDHGFYHTRLTKLSSLCSPFCSYTTHRLKVKILGTPPAGIEPIIMLLRRVAQRMPRWMGRCRVGQKQWSHLQPWWFVCGRVSSISSVYSRTTQCLRLLAPALEKKSKQIGPKNVLFVLCGLK